MTDTEYEFCGYTKLLVRREASNSFTYCPNCYAKNVIDPGHEDAAVVEVEFVTNTDVL